VLDLDRPVRAYLPGFRLADEHATATVTPRHLLSHTAGFDADVVTETTNGEDAIATFVEEYLPTVGQLFAPGEHHSYNNSGFSLLGRTVEVLRGKPYRRVLRERLVDPLGLRHVAARADEAILFRTSVGHVPTGADGQQTPARPWRLRYSNEPSGTLCWPCQRMTYSSSLGCTYGRASRPIAPGVVSRSPAGDARAAGSGSQAPHRRGPVGARATDRAAWPGPASSPGHRARRR
jgi:CubicO group peptidase (beta-lactamase class C family)